jgi:hypothetical protein
MEIEGKVVRNDDFSQAHKDQVVGAYLTEYYGIKTELALQSCLHSSYQQ